MNCDQAREMLSANRRGGTHAALESSQSCISRISADLGGSVLVQSDDGTEVAKKTEAEPSGDGPFSVDGVEINYCAAMGRGTRSGRD